MQLLHSNKQIAAAHAEQVQAALPTWLALLLSTRVLFSSANVDLQPAPPWHSGCMYSPPPRPEPTAPPAA